MKNILVVGGVKDLHSELQKRKVKYTLLMPKQNYDVKLFTQAEKVLIFDFKDKEHILSVIKALHELEPFEAVVCVAEKEQSIACEISEALNLLNTSSLAVQLTQNKYLLRKILEENNISRVNYSLCNTKDQLVKFSESNGFPFIIKPIDQWASIGVVKISNADELNRYVENDDLHYPLLAEEFLNGIEISIETFTVNEHHLLLAFTEKILHKNTFIEIGHNIPYIISPGMENEIRNLIIKLFGLINHNFGPAHTEIIITKDGPKVVESHTRPGGDNITKLIELSSGIDVINLLLDYQLKERDINELPELGDYSGFTSVRYLTAEPGEIVSVAGIEELKNIQGVVKVNINVKTGDTVRPLNHSFDRIGNIIIQGSTKEAIKDIEDKINKTLKILTRRGVQQEEEILT